ncbi:MAG: hypothetical protein AAF514_21930 [Verrucomicrobiota bacterium]
MNRLVGWAARVFGMTLRDERTGEVLGKALVIPWRGKVHLIGYRNETPLTPEFLPQERITYWKQTLGFRSYPDPDYQRLKGAGGNATKEEEEDG